MKCNPGADLSSCVRCHRKQIDCFYENHRRGRKLGTKVRTHAKSQSTPKSSTDRSHSRRVTLPGVNDNNHPLLFAETRTVAGEHQASSPVFQEARASQSTEESSSTAKDKKVDGLSPFCLLNKHAMSGSYSVRNVLAAEPVGGTTLESDSRVRDMHPESSLQEYSHDPVAMGLIKLPAAMQLFDSFIKYMAPYIIHFDPTLHTYDYVQQRSSFLLCTILSASAKIFNPDLHPKLRKHAEELLAKAFISGEKSIDTLKAVLMLTYWKEPDDTRVWQLVGYACRMCVELRGRKTHTRNADVAMLAIPPLIARERRNVERTWLTLFVYDRSISLQIGKQWMLHIDDLTRRVDTWYQHELAIPNGDAILAAFVQLRVLSSDLLDVLEIDVSSGNQQQQEMLLHLFDTDLDKWEKRWNDVFEKTSLGPCHMFLYRFYGFHTRLYINSLRLQIMLFYSTTGAKQALWLAYSSALGMLQAIVDILGPAQLLYYAQDSIHAMTAYAAVFLIKILLSMPEALATTAESTITTLLTRTSEVFGGQCATPTTGCAYQSRFLKNVVKQYWSSKKPKSASDANAVHHADAESAKQRTGMEPAAPTGDLGYNNDTQLEPMDSSYKSQSDGSRSHETMGSNIDGGFSMGSSAMFPFIGQKSPESGSQPFWHQNVMDLDIFEGLFSDACFYSEDAILMPSLF